jgi:hypothetical protein
MNEKRGGGVGQRRSYIEEWKKREGVLGEVRGTEKK